MVNIIEKWYLSQRKAGCVCCLEDNVYAVLNMDYMSFDCSCATRYDEDSCVRLVAFKVAIVCS